MTFNIATGFDSQQREELFTTVDLGDEALREIVTDVFRKLDYIQRENLLRKLAKDKKLTVVETNA